MAKSHPMSGVLSPAAFAEKDPMASRMSDAMSKLHVDPSSRASYGSDPSPSYPAHLYHLTLNTSAASAPNPRPPQEVRNGTPASILAPLNPCFPTPPTPSKTKRPSSKRPPVPPRNPTATVPPATAPPSPPPRPSQAHRMTCLRRTAASPMAPGGTRINLPSADRSHLLATSYQRSRSNNRPWVNSASTSPHPPVAACARHAHSPSPAMSIPTSKARRWKGTTPHLAPASFPHSSRAAAGPLP